MQKNLRKTKSFNIQTAIENFDEKKSLEQAKNLYEQYKEINFRRLKISLELVRILYIAHEVYCNPGFRSDLQPTDNVDRLEFNSFREYLENVGIVEKTAERWLKRYNPEEDRLLSSDEVEELKEINNKFILNAHETITQEDKSKQIKSKIKKCEKDKKEKEQTQKKNDFNNNYLKNEFFQECGIEATRSNKTEFAGALYQIYAFVFSLHDLDSRLKFIKLVYKLIEKLKNETESKIEKGEKENVKLSA